MTSRESLQEETLEAILRAIQPSISAATFQASEELAKMVVDEILGPSEKEDEMEELCADMDNFAKED